MPIIFGKKSSIPGACGVCGARAGPYGVTNLQYPKMHEIMWVCDDCISREKWERIYSMSGVKLTEIEERCIGIACANISDSFLSDISENFTSSYYEGIGAVVDCDKEAIKEIFILYSKKLLTEYQNQLRKMS